jgi:fatty acid desaturase
MKKAKVAGLKILATVLFMVAVLVPYFLQGAFGWGSGLILTGPLVMMGIWLRPGWPGRPTFAKLLCDHESYPLMIRPERATTAPRMPQSPH